MTNIIFVFILIVLIFLSLSLIFCIISKSFSEAKQIAPTHTVLTIKNHEDCIEGTIRMIMDMYSKSFKSIPPLIVLNSGCSDDTLLIIKKLSKRYDFIHILSLDEYEEFLHNFSIMF